MLDSVQQPIRLDWHSYFVKFCEAHGGSPLVHGGRLLFQDGWTYSKSDHAGPEWPPPTDPRERNQLIRAYWLRRRGIVLFEIQTLKRDIELLEQMQRSKSVPLQEVRMVEGEAAHPVTGTMIKTVKPQTSDLDLSDKKGRLHWLQNDLRECNRYLGEIAGG